MITGFEVRVRDVYTADRARRGASRATRLPVPRDRLDRPEPQPLHRARLEKVVTFIVLVLIVLVAAFNIIGMLTMMVIRKTREIGILKAMGAKSATVTRIFILAGGIIGIIGTIAGAGFGLVACGLLNKYRLVSLPGDVYFIKNLPVQRAGAGRRRRLRRGHRHHVRRHDLPGPEGGEARAAGGDTI